MGASTTKYAGHSTSAISPAIWGNCPLESLAVGRVAGTFFRDDFVNWTNTTATPYTISTDSTSTCTAVATEVSGVVRLATGAVDNREAYIGANDNAAGMIKVVGDSGQPCWFEARIRTNAITAASLIVGMMNEGEVASDLMAATQTDAAMLDTSLPDFIGFAVAGDTDPDGLDAIYQTQTTTSGGFITHSNAAQTLVADTWYKVGWWFDGTNYIRYYVDGVQTGTDLLYSTAEVPDGEELMFVAGCKSGGAANKQLDVDWWQAAMTFD